MNKAELMQYKLIMQPDEAEVRAKLVERPDDPDLWYELGMALANKGENMAAVNAFSAGIPYAPFDACLHFGRGRKMNSADLFWPSIAELTLAHRLDATEWTFLYYRATTYNLHGYFEESCEDFKECVRIAGPDEACPMIHWLFTTYLLELKDPSRAVESLKLIPLDAAAPQMDYGYLRCFKLYTGQISKEEFVDIEDMKKKCLKRPGRIELELNTMYYGLFAYCVYTNDMEGAKRALQELLKIAIPESFGYLKAVSHARELGLME